MVFATARRAGVSQRRDTAVGLPEATDVVHQEVDPGESVTRTDTYFGSMVPELVASFSWCSSASGMCSGCSISA